MNDTTSRDAREPRFTPFSDSKLVVSHLQPIVDNLQLFFTDACSRTLVHFAERGWMRDANLFAYEVRKDVLEKLRALGANVNVEESSEVPDALAFQLGRLALGGLLLNLPGLNLRIRKGRESEIPPAGTEQMRGFYNWNLFAFDDLGNQEPIPLHLLLLWDVDSNQQLDRMSLICPKGETDREVGWYWQELIPIRLLASPPSNGRDFRTAFQVENSDVPLTPRGSVNDSAAPRIKKKKKQRA